MTHPLDLQIAEIERRFKTTTVANADGSRIVTIADFPLPPGWNRKAVNIRFLVPVGYPAARPDSFWTDADLRTVDEAMPINAAMQQPWPGEPPYLWFSWHPQQWSPQQDSLTSYVGVIASRLRHPK